MDAVFPGRTTPGCSLSRKFTDLRDVPGIAPPLVDRGLADEREAPDGGVAEDLPEPLLPDGPEPDMLVPVKPAPESALAVVEVNDPEAGKTDQVVDL
ncbi:MAG: hypothetical protein XE10_2100 [Methanoculleus marisnigri]|uniref:Uncharacterized protein n=1 Tax=Methanoculleus marisnigri TaxID=2198 RepID=A0A117MDL8_9EURY|nr:MAG: hypothetical protein XE10_2100 [Methanoculleus marisnigri]